MNGKAKCKTLKAIRQKIAEENNIPYTASECSHQGDCKGTCPQCEEEVRYLEQELEKRKKAGCSVTVDGVAEPVPAAVADDPFRTDMFDDGLTLGILPLSSRNIDAE